MLILHNIRR